MMRTLDPHTLKIAPSLLAADMACFKTALDAIHAVPDILMLHVDVMDGHFVPNLAIGPQVVSAIRPHTPLFLDVHLMVTDPARFIPIYHEAGADSLTFHVECPNLMAHIRLCRKLGCGVGLALNPETSPETLRPYLDEIDRILVMTVNPGWAGQTFITSQLEKIKAIRTMIDDAAAPIDLAVDGGVTVDNAPDLHALGATTLVAGSSFFNAAPAEYASIVTRMLG